MSYAITANGDVTATGGWNCSETGFVYDTATKSLPGNVAPASSGYASVANTTGLNVGTGAFTQSVTGLTVGTVYFGRAYSRNTAGYAYGAEVSWSYEQGAFASTLGDASLAATATFSSPAAFASTLDNATLASVAVVSAPVAFASTLGNASLAAAATSTPIATTFAATLDDASLLATATASGAGPATTAAACLLMGL